MSNKPAPALMVALLASLTTTGCATSLPFSRHPQTEVIAGPQLPQAPPKVWPAACLERAEEEPPPVQPIRNPDGSLNRIATLEGRVAQLGGERTRLAMIHSACVDEHEHDREPQG